MILFSFYQINTIYNLPHDWGTASILVSLLPNHPATLAELLSLVGNSVTASVRMSSPTKVWKMTFSHYPLVNCVLFRGSQIWLLLDNRFSYKSSCNTLSTWSLKSWTWYNGHYSFLAKPLKRLNSALFYFKKYDYIQNDIPQTAQPLLYESETHQHLQPAKSAFSNGKLKVKALNAEGRCMIVSIGLGC